MRRRRGPETHTQNHERWLVSYADFITLLFAFFTMLYAISIVDATSAEKLVTSIRDSFQEQGTAGAEEAAAAGAVPIILESGDRPSKGVTEDEQLDRLADRTREIAERTAEGISVRETEEGLVISLAGTSFFPDGGVRIPDALRGELGQIAAMISELPNHLRIEGHTDDRPVSSLRFPSNWHLSATRAVEIVRVFESAGIAPHRLSATGFAAERPLASNRSEEGRQINRRVDLVVLRSSGG